MLNVFNRGAARERVRDRVRDTIARMSETATLPTLPETARTGLRLAQNLETDVKKLSAVIAADVGLAACVLRLANSAAYAARQRATTLQAAIVTVGMRKVCNIIVAAGTRPIYRAAGHHAGALWNHALLVGLAAEEVTRIRAAGDPNLCFLPGLFHDVGRIVFLLADPVAFAEVDAGKRRRNRTAVETARFGLDHAEIGAALAEQWGLAPEQCDAIRWHHEPQRAGDGRALASLLHAADVLAHRVDASPGVDSDDGGLQLSDADWATGVEHVRARFQEHQAVFD